MADRKRKESFGDLRKYSVNIPMNDFLKMVEIANNYDAVLQSLDQIKDEVIALRGLFLEVLDKVKDLEKMV